MGAEERRKHDQQATQQAQARQSFAAALAAGDAHAVPRDRFGVAIKAGMKVLYRPNVDMIFDVVDVRPVLDPRMPPGIATIVLQAAAPVTARVGQPLVSMIVIATDAPKDGATQDPPPSGDPVDPPSGDPVPDPPAAESPTEVHTPPSLHLVTTDGA